MDRIEVAKVPKTKRAKRQLYATLCYYYPQYTLQDAENMASRDLSLLLKTARRLDALNMYNLTQIAAAPHTKKGEGVKVLSKHFSKEAKNG